MYYAFKWIGGKMKYHFKYHKEENGYWAECCEIDGCVTQANSLDDLRTNCSEALNLMLDEPDNSNVTFSLPDENLNGKRNIINIEVEPEIAFSVLLKNYRINHNITQKEAANILQMKNIYSYQRLERKANPSLLIMKKIKTAFPEINLQQIF